MNDHKIKERIRRVLVTDLFVDIEEEKISFQDGLQSVIGLDSLGFVELRLQCEKMFDIHISDEDFSSENFQNIGTVAEMVQKIQGR